MCHGYSQKKKKKVLPVMPQPKQIQLTSIRTRVRSLASLSGHCCELWCRLQMWFGSHVAVAVVQASSCGSDLTLSLGTSICLRFSLKKEKKKSFIKIHPAIFKRKDHWSSSRSNCQGIAEALPRFRCDPGAQIPGTDSLETGILPRMLLAGGAAHRRAPRGRRGHTLTPHVACLSFGDPCSTWGRT